MKKIVVYGGAILVMTLLQLACSLDLKSKQILAQEINDIATTYAPDKRTALFDIIVIKGKSEYILSGESNLPHAVDSLKARLKANGIPFEDNIELLPSAALEGKTSALITISVANLRSNPKHSAELATQALLGTVVKVLKKEGNWYLVQTPDAYLAWVDAGGIHLMDEKALSNWTSSEKIIFTATYGHAVETEENRQRVSDLVAGNILELLSVDKNFFTVRFPDGRQASVSRNEAMEYTSWISNLNTDADALIETAEALMGVPYLWGGTSTKGVDCSGFTKTIYFLNGMVLPRDASQQVHTGKPVDSLSNYKVMEKGDLLFFGRKATDSTAEKVVHVGMWIGDHKFIHASDRVRISSVDKEDPAYDAYNVGRYLRSKRILNQEDGAILKVKKADEVKG